MKIIVLLTGVGLLLGVGGPGATTPLSKAASQAQPQAQTPAWSWPLAMEDGRPPAIVRPFRPPSRRWLSGHRGVDLAASPGAAVMAAGAGTVVFTGTLFGEDVVVVSHGGVRTSYEPVAAVVRVGERVARGDVLGALTTDGPNMAGDRSDDDQTGDGRDGGDSGPQPVSRPGTVLHWGLLAGHGHGVRYYDPLLLLLLGFGHLRLEPVTDTPGPPPS